MFQAFPRQNARHAFRLLQKRMRLHLLTLGAALSLVVAACSSGSHVCSSTGQALTVCPTGTIIQGVDVSVYQGTVDWAKVKAAGVDFAFARVSDGTGTLDTTFAANWKGMQAAGIVRGVYQFFEPGEDPVKQADLVMSQVKAAGGFEAGDLPPVMDMEVTGGQTDATIQANMQAWLTEIEKTYGRNGIIYTNESTSTHFGGKFTSYPLWVASWGGTCPTMPDGFTAWKFWQYADTGTINGISGAVDHDEFNGSLSDLQTWANPSPPPSDGGTPPPSDAGTTSDSGGAHDASTSTPDATAPMADAATNPCGP